MLENISTESTHHKLSPNETSKSQITSKKRDIQKIGKYQFSFSQKIGSGMSGQVYVGIDSQKNQLVCIKIIDRMNFKSQNQIKLLQNEIRCQKNCNSQSTIQIKEIYDTSSFCFIVSEFCQGGDLYRLLMSTEDGLSEQLVIIFAKQIANSLKILKDKKIIHRDIKSQNIMIKGGKCKLGDFGFAVQEELLSKYKINLGSPLYMSLQSLLFSEYSYASDVFSFGIVLYEMLHKKSPWESQTEQELIKKIQNTPLKIKENISESLKELIQNCLKLNISQRITIQQILTHKLLIN